MLREPIAVTGMGIASALGWSPETTWSAIERELSGLRPLTAFHSPRFGQVPVGEVTPIDAPPQITDDTRATWLAWHAAESAWRNAGSKDLPLNRIATVLGASTGGMLESEDYLSELITTGSANPQKLARHTCADATEVISARLGIEGSIYTVSNACASGNAAIALACDLLSQGEAEMVLAGGVDALSRLTLNGFASLLVMAPDGCRPFDVDRQGMNLGEGAAMLVLETLSSARNRQAEIKGLIWGWASTCDAYHPSAPASDGEGAKRAMEEALEMAHLAPEVVDYINAHGSGTVENDRAEGAAIAALFSEFRPLVSSTKRFFGHTLAAAGAIEAVTCLLALAHQQAPANLGCRTQCSQISLNLADHTVAAPLQVAMSNSLGFGGSNSTIILSRPDWERP